MLLIDDAKYARPNGSTIAPEDRLYPTGGFKSFGHFAWSVARGGRRGGAPAHRDAALALKSWDDLQWKSPSGAFEESDADGGVLVPPEYSREIYTRSLDQNQILSYLDPIAIKGNTLRIPAWKEESRAEGSRHGGVIGYWKGEGDQYTSTSPDFRMISLRLHKLIVGIYATEELIEDSPIAIEQYLFPLAAAEINFKINDSVINGTGNGMPQGILKTDSRITVSAVSGQGANTIVAQNVVSMNNRIVPMFRRRYIWLYNPEAEQSLTRMFVGTGQYAAANLLYYDDDGVLRMMGRPALPIEQCSALGTEGDLIAFSTDGYASIVKQGGIDASMSMHLRFDYDESMFKFRFRFDGQPKDNVALTPYKGTNTTSSVVTLSSTRT